MNRGRMITVELPDSAILLCVRVSEAETAKYPAEEQLDLALISQFGLEPYLTWPGTINEENLLIELDFTG